MKTFSILGKHRKKVDLLLTLMDDFDKSVLRRLVYDFYVTWKMLATAELLKTAMQEQTSLSGGVTNMKVV